MAQAERLDALKISKLPYQSHKCEVFGSSMHYIDEGQGAPILFLHGMPTSCYLWRNVIPYLSGQARCLAPDLMGMGLSDKPDIAYTVFDHINYFTQFMEQLDLDKVTLVTHGWGSVIGLSYAAAHPDKITGLAFLEAHLRPMHSSELALPLQELAAKLCHYRTMKNAIIKENYLIEQWLPLSIARHLTTYEMNYYREPFSTETSRRLLWQYLRELPLDDQPTKVKAQIQHYSNYLQKTSIPKLMFYAIPGFNTPISTVAWAKSHLSNLELCAIEGSLHHAPESHPKVVGNALEAWYSKIACSAH